jgi:predicted MPP superfamily phosphohydrolase
MNIIRILIPALLIFLLDYYAFQALRTISGNWSQITRNIVFSIYWLVPILAIGMMTAGAYGWLESLNKTTYTFLRSFLTIAYVAKIPMVALLLIDDLRRLFVYAQAQFNGTTEYSKSRSNFLATTGVILGALPFVTLIYGIIRNRYRYKIFRETVKLENLPESLKGLKIVQISDIHSGSFDQIDPVKRAVDLINQEEADLVFFTGDLVNSIAAEMTNYIDVFSEIKAKKGVFSVLGNHDYGDYHNWSSVEEKKANLDALKGIHRQMGWDLLLNENRILEVNQEKFAVIGVENYSASAHFPKYGDLKKAYAGAENMPLKLLLSHDPSHWENQILDTDIDLTFSGHTHGMQFGIEIPGWFKWSPVKYAYKQWAGLYQTGKQYLYVNRGLGFLGYPGRVGILPEITVIELA